MTTIFETGAPQTIAQVLANKDARAALQAQLVATKAPATIVVAKLNIPGPIKANQTLSRVFTAGMAAWQNRLATADVSQTISLTGISRPGGSSLKSLLSRRPS
nr:citrate lyase holo-[acyl-carrier protein] synthase [Lactiplantibacillus plantarum]